MYCRSSSARDQVVSKETHLAGGKLDRHGFPADESCVLSVHRYRHIEYKLIARITCPNARAVLAIGKKLSRLVFIFRWSWLY